MTKGRRLAAVALAVLSFAACGRSPAEDAGVLAGTGVLDETAVVLATGSAVPEARMPTTSGAAVDSGVTTDTAASPPGGSATPTTARRSATTTSTAKSPSSSTGSSAADLEKLMSTAGPAGYDRDDDEEEGNGEIDFEAAVEYDGEDDAEEFLRRHHFEGGWDRSWTRSDYDEDDEDALWTHVSDTVYRFREASGANAYMDRMVKFAESMQGEDFRVGTFPVSGIPGAKGYTVSHPEWGETAAVIFTKGRHTGLIDATEESADKAKEIASSMARDQYSRL